MTKRYFGSTVALVLVAIIISLLGAAVVIGLLVTVPLTKLMMAHAYLLAPSDGTGGR